MCSHLLYWVTPSMERVFLSDELYIDCFKKNSIELASSYVTEHLLSSQLFNVTCIILHGSNSLCVCVCVLGQWWLSPRQFKINIFEIFVQNRISGWHFVCRKMRIAFRTQSFCITRTYEQRANCRNYANIANPFSNWICRETNSSNGETWWQCWRRRRNCNFWISAEMYCAVHGHISVFNNSLRWGVWCWMQHIWSGTQWGVFSNWCPT